MIISPARAMHHYPTREDNLLVCDSYVDASYMIAFSYPIVLIVICTVYAVLTRKIPEAFNESKHIGECEMRLSTAPASMTSAQCTHTGIGTSGENETEKSTFSCPDTVCACLF